MSFWHILWRYLPGFGARKMRYDFSKRSPSGVFYVLNLLTTGTILVHVRFDADQKPTLSIRLQKNLIDELSGPEAIVPPQERRPIMGDLKDVRITGENCRIRNDCGAWYDFATIAGEEHLIILSVSPTGYTQ